MLTLGEAKKEIEADLDRAKTSAAFLGKSLAFEKGYLISKLAVALIKIEEQKQIIKEINQLKNY